MVARILTTTMLLVVYACTAFPTFAEEPLPRRLRVLSYNVHHGAGVDGKLDLERVAKVVRSVKPDLVALQEVDQKVRRTNSVDQPAELARLLKMHVVFGANIDLQGGRYGNAVLSRYPIRGHENHRLPNEGGGEQRGVLEAKIAWPGVARPLRLLATHFDHRRDDTERLASAKAVNDLVRRDDHPALLAGDLNDTPDGETLRILSEEWTSTNRERRPTVPVDRPERQIDYVLTRPARCWKVVEVRVLKEAVASDHRPILAVLELLPVEKPGPSKPDEPSRR